MENTIDVDGKRYNLSQISPSALEVVQMTQFAQAEAQRKNIEAKVANIAFQAMLTNLRVTLATEPTYASSPEDEPTAAIPEEATNVPLAN
jgi:hypothetical protein